MTRGREMDRCQIRDRKDETTVDGPPTPQACETMAGGREVDTGESEGMVSKASL